jgi:hypothetical protein
MPFTLAIEKFMDKQERSLAENACLELDHFSYFLRLPVKLKE